MADQPPRHPVSGQFLPAWDAMTGTGATDTSSARPPAYPDSLPGGLYLAPADVQAAYKIGLAAAGGTVAEDLSYGMAPGAYPNVSGG